MTRPGGLTADQIAAIRARADAATPGPWPHSWDRPENAWANLAADSAFIAHARTDILALLDALAESSAEVKRLRNALTDCALYGRGATSRKARAALEGK